MLRLEFTPNSAEFTIVNSNGKFIHIKFPHAPQDISYGQVDNAASFLVTSDTLCTVFEEEGEVVAIFTKETETPTDLLLAVTPPRPEDCQIQLNVVGGNYQKDALDPSLWSLRLSEPEVKMLFSPTSMQAMSYSPRPLDFVALMEGDPWQVGPGERWPEWAISLYDYIDTTGTLRRPRPVRLGTPVISTVPTDGDWTKNTKSDYQSQWLDGLEPQERYDIEQIKTGRTAPKRRIYFLAVCDHSIIDQNPELLIYLPSGTDTVRYVPEMVGLQKYKGNDRQWWGYYDFHQEDGLRYVDGYCYLSVHLPMSIVRALPMRLRYKTTGYSSGESGLDDPEELNEDAVKDDYSLLLSVEKSNPIKVGIKDSNQSMNSSKLDDCGCDSS